MLRVDDGVRLKGSLHVAVVPVSIEAILQVPLHRLLQALHPGRSLLPACAAEYFLLRTFPQWSRCGILGTSGEILLLSPLHCYVSRSLPTDAPCLNTVTSLIQTCPSPGSQNLWSCNVPAPAPAQPIQCTLHAFIVRAISMHIRPMRMPARPHAQKEPEDRLHMILPRSKGRNAGPLRATVLLTISAMQDRMFCDR